MENKTSNPADIIAHVTGYWMTQALYVAAKLNVFDHLQSGAKNSQQLAQLTNAQSENLYRVLRAVASIGYLEETSHQQFKITPLGEFLTQDHPATLKSFVIMHGDNWHWDAWGKLIDSVKTGISGIKLKSGMELFEFLQKDAVNTQTFSHCMSNLSKRVAPIIAQAYPQSHFVEIVDMGGAMGDLLAEFLKRNAQCRGILFDLPEVIQVAKNSPSLLNFKDRLQFMEGDFFKQAPPNADIYLLKYILHDWDDERAKKILSNIKNHAAPTSKILIIEQLIPAEPNAKDRSKFVDLEMLALTLGGRERTLEQFKKILEPIGLKLNNLIPTQSAFYILEVSSIN